MAKLKASVTRFSANLNRPVANANHAWQCRRGLLLRIHTQDGRIGYGEASPLPNYSPDSLEKCEQWLSHFELFSEEELDVLRIEQFLERMPMSVPAARFAVETALLDLLAQERNESIAQVLGAKHEIAARCGLIRQGDAMRSVNELLSRGITHGKLKVGRNWPAELAIIRAIRELHPDFQLRIDVNGAWSLSEALQHLQTLRNQNLEFVEQPVQPSKMHNLISCPLPLAADENMHSSFGRGALDALAEDDALVAVVLKPTVLGGLLACMKHSEWAHRHGAASVASHCFEGAVGTAAVAELAVATRGKFAAGVDRHEALDVLPQAHIPQLEGNSLHTHRGGLGVVFAPES